MLTESHAQVVRLLAKAPRCNQWYPGTYKMFSPAYFGSVCAELSPQLAPFVLDEFSMEGKGLPAVLFGAAASSRTSLAGGWGGGASAPWRVRTSRGDVACVVGEQDASARLPASSFPPVICGAILSMGLTWIIGN